MIINTIVQLTMMIVIFVFSGEVLGGGWPGAQFCQKSEYDDNGRWKYVDGTPECLKARTDLRIMMGVGAGFGIVIG